MDETTNLQSTTQEVQTAAENQTQQSVEDMPEKVSALQKFINGLFGGNKETEAAEPEKKDEAAASGAEGEKNFTQADIDAAIEKAKEKWLAEAEEAERIKKLSPEERAKEEQEKLVTENASLRSQLLQKELRETATKLLEEEGFPVGLADVLDYSSKERMEETLKKTTTTFRDSLGAAIQSRLKGKTPEGLGGAASAESLLREQIAKSIRGN